MNRVLLSAVAAALFLASSVWAQDDETPPPVDAPEPPELEREPAPLPPKVTSGEQLSEPSVVIRTDDEGQIIEEYSQDGRIYMVKVTPKNLPAYYLYDLDGDGLFEDLDPNSPIKPVYWKVAEWQ